MNATTPTAASLSYRQVSRAFWLYLILPAAVAVVVLLVWGEPRLALVVALIGALCLAGAIAYRLSLKKLVRFQLLGWDGHLETLQVYSEELPVYRFPDYFLAIEHLLAGRSPRKVQSSHHAMLRDLLQLTNEKMSPPQNKPWAVDYKKERYFPDDHFWAIPRDGLIVRLKDPPWEENARLEIATADDSVADDLSHKIKERANEASVYRNRLITIDMTEPVKEEAGYYEPAGRLKVIFKPRPEVERGDIVLATEAEKILERNVFDFHNRRRELKAVGLPAQKGILFYGPPGSGKTHTCKYICRRLEGLTFVVVTGKNLTHIRSICNVAKSLQPVLLILEDVDLIFSSREINLYSSALGDFMDELDGFQPDDDIAFILTTNAIERLESAIKDRPGRVAQCLEFDYPDQTLRVELLKMLVEPFPREVDLAAVAEQVGRVSQAFLAQMVERGVQVALEKQEFRTEEYLLTDDCLLEAFREMTSQNNRYVKTILGFTG